MEKATTKARWLAATVAVGLAGMAAREGPQIGAAQGALVKTGPLAASRSILGVLTCG